MRVMHRFKYFKAEIEKVRKANIFIIALLKGRRSALIAAAVAGQLDLGRVA